MKKMTNRVTALFAVVAMLGSLMCMSANAENTVEQYHDNVTIDGIDMCEKSCYFGENDNRATFDAYWESTVKKTDNSISTIIYGGTGEKYNDPSLVKKFDGSSITFHIINKEQDYQNDDCAKILKTNYVRMLSGKSHDLRDIKGSGYIRFWMYVDSLGAEATEHKFTLTSNNDTNRVNFTVGADELNTWVKREIKLSELLGNHSGEGIEWFQINPDTNLTEDYTISFQNIGFYYPEALKQNDFHELKYMIFGDGRVNGNWFSQSYSWGNDITVDGVRYDDCLDSAHTFFGRESLRLIYPGKNTDVNFGGRFWGGKLMQKDWRTDNKLINNVQDISGYNDAYLQFMVYTDAEDLSQLPSIWIGSDSNAIGVTEETYGSYNESYEWLKTDFGKNIESGKWCNVKIRLSDLYSQNDRFDKRALTYVRFYAPGTIDKTYNIYIQNLGLYDSQTVRIDTLEQRNNKVEISFTASNAADAAVYRVYENGAVYETQSTSLLTDIKNYDTVNSYAVEALDANGRVISKSETKSLAVYKLGLKAESENVIYGSDGKLNNVSALFYADKWSSPGENFTDSAAALGGKSWTVKNCDTYNENDVANAVQVEFKNSPRNVNEDMYLEFLIYPDTNKFTKKHIGVWNSGAEHSQWIEIEAGKWNLVRVKLSDMGCKGALSADTLKLSMPVPDDKSKFDMYIQNLRYVSVYDDTFVLKDGS